MAAAQLSGLRAVVTGGSSGIGERLAATLVEEGARVAVIDARMGDARPGVPVFLANIGDTAEVEAAVSSAAEELGGIDLLVNNAAMSATGTVETSSEDDWWAALNINVVGVARVSRAALRWLRQSPAPSIVNVCSVAAHVGLENRAIYSASKGAVAALTRAMAADHLGDGIRVNSVSPGTADTPWVQRLIEASADPAEEFRRLKDRQPHGRLVSMDEVVAAVIYLLHPSSGSTTGADLVVDGGLTSLKVMRPNQEQT